MALFNESVKVYAGKWSVVKETPLAAEDVALIDRGVVVDSKFGLSVCFTMKAGGQTYFPVSTDSEVGAGSIVDINNVQVVELAKPGEDNIIRLKVK